MNRLITIPISHFCEKARWALQWSKIPYAEEMHLQGFHFFPTYRWAKCDSVPVLICQDGALKDSTDILKWADKNAPEDRKLYPRQPELHHQVEVFEEYLDGFGAAGRLWMYTYVLGDLPLILSYSAKHNVPWYQRKLMPLIFPVLKKKLEEILGMTDRSRAESQQVIDTVFDDIAKRLSDGRSFLIGNQFTAADLTFAALAAAVLIPENYGVALPKLEELPASMSEQIRKWRAHPAGQFAARLYRDFRQN